MVSTSISVRCSGRWEQDVPCVDVLEDVLFLHDVRGSDGRSACDGITGVRTAHRAGLELVSDLLAADDAAQGEAVRETLRARVSGTGGDNVQCVARRLTFAVIMISGRTPEYSIA